jgi:hypothetical protein
VIAASAERTRLAHRVGDGIEVSLLWHQPTGRITLGVLDRGTGERFHLEVERRDALDAFSRPEVYVRRHAAGRRRPGTTSDAGSACFCEPDRGNALLLADEGELSPSEGRTPAGAHRPAARRVSPRGPAGRG